MSNKVIGIDLGTTNSVMAVMEGGKPTVITNEEGNRTTPSIVAYDKKGNELLVGQLAKRQAVINPENTFSSIKRFIGRKFKEIEHDLKMVTYEVKASENDNIKIVCPVMQKELTPEEISGQILRKLAGDAGKFLQQKITKAVITVPAYFNDSQRQATKDAGKIAGLDVLRIVNEPTAASLAYGLDKNIKEGIILVFDLGGGTFDVSLLEVADGLFEVLSTSGDTYLGGDDFDNVIVSYLLEDFQTKENIDLSKDNQALQRLTEAAEKAKIELSALNESNINIPFIASVNNEPKHIDTILSRSKFESLSQHLIEKCRIPVINAIKDAKIKKEEISEVVLVGGSTRIPAIKTLVKDIVPKEPNQSVNPDEVVAVGAAVQGGILVGEVNSILLLDVTPLSLGVETYGGLMTTLIPRNTTIPTERNEVFSTATDNQEFVEVHVLQGERDVAAQNKSLGRFKLENIPLAPRGIPQIKVTFDINVDGILSVKARELTSGLEQSIKIEGASNLEKDEIDKIIQDAEAFEQEDAKKKELIVNINDIEYNVDYYEKNIETKLSEANLNSTEKEKIENAKEIIKNAKALVAKRYTVNNILTLEEEIKSLSDQIKQALQTLGSAITQEPEKNEPKSESSSKVIEADINEED